jgi:hypothetical protein
VTCGRPTTPEPAAVAVRAHGATVRTWRAVRPRRGAWAAPSLGHLRTAAGVASVKSCSRVRPFSFDSPEGPDGVVPGERLSDEVDTVAVEERSGRPCSAAAS